MMPVHLGSGDALTRMTARRAEGGSSHLRPDRMTTTGPTPTPAQTAAPDRSHPEPDGPHHTQPQPRHEGETGQRPLSRPGWLGGGPGWWAAVTPQTRDCRPEWCGGADTNTDSWPNRGCDRSPDRICLDVDGSGAPPPETLGRATQLEAGDQSRNVVRTTKG